MDGRRMRLVFALRSPRRARRSLPLGRQPGFETAHAAADKMQGAIKRRLLKLLPVAMGAALFLAALWVLYHELRKYPPESILRSLEAIPAQAILLAFLLSAANYLILIQFDALAFRSIGEHLPYRRIMLAAFVGYALSNNAGFNTISGSSVRYRFYAAWGVPGGEIFRVIVFYSLTFWVGLFWLGGTLFLFQPMDIPAALRIPFDTVRPLGAILLLLGVAYLVLCALARKSLHLWRLEIALPSLRMAVFQIVLAALDWMLVSAVLYALLQPADRIPYLSFLGIFMLAQIAGLVSQVPGGIGVFETVIVLLLREILPSPQILGALLAFRAIYYLLPLVVALVLMGVHEIVEKRGKGDAEMPG